MIQVSAITKSFGNTRALKGVSLTVDRGSLFGLIGADGAGKTTLIGILTSLLTADGGGAVVDGCDTVRDRRTLRASIGYMPQRFSLYQDLSVMENLLFFADIFGVRGRGRDERITELLRFARLESFVTRRAANLSGGMKQKLALCCCLIHRPTVLFLDEPTVGVDPISRRELWDILKSLRGEGITQFVSTPYMDETDYCDHLAIMHEGAVIARGTPNELVGRYPHTLLRAADTRCPPGLSDSDSLPETVRAIYPAGGDLHVAVCRGADRAALAEALRPRIPGLRRLEPVTPRLEDLFIHLVKSPSGEAATGTTRPASPQTTRDSSCPTS
jgi:ABC-type multidrug transport system ATPase subunit